MTLAGDADGFAFPRNDYSRVPYRAYHDAAIYARELDRVFRGRAWTHVALDAEFPNPGDFRASWMGDTPVIMHRDRDGAVHGFVNRCAHRGALVRREIAGNADNHTCIYHQWCYTPAGRLTSIPFRRGVKGKGGLDADFDMDAHGLRRLKVDQVAGAWFATFADDFEPLLDYLGPPVVAQIERMFHRPIRVLGYHRQRIHGNWKMFAENTRDNYHASLLHEFLVTFGLDRATQTGGVTMDARHRHNITWAEAASDTADFAREMYSAANIRNDELRLRDPRLVEFLPEQFGDNLNLSVTTVFPNAVFIQVSNSLATRQIRPKGIGAFEVFQTLVGYQDDTPAMTEHRLRQANLVGPAGLVSMEDGEAIEIAYRASKPEIEGSTVIEMGGGGPITDRDYRVTDVPLRGFWSYWAELMGYEPQALSDDRRDPMITAAERDAVLALMADYGCLIDAGRYDDWLALFDEDCVYRVVPRENLTLGLPAAIMSCDNKDMLRDRVTALTDANKYNIHVARHVIGLPRVTRIAPDMLAVEAAYTVFQSDQEGEARLFSVGSYDDRVRVVGGRLLLQQKIVIVDSFAVPSLLATPL